MMAIQKKRFVPTEEGSILIDDIDINQDARNYSHPGAGGGSMCTDPPHPISQPGGRSYESE